SVFPGSPVDYRIETSTVVAIDAAGREVWRHCFPERLAKSFYDSEWGLRRCTFRDVDGDGAVETLFVYVPIDFASVGTELFCFSQEGRVKWQFTPGRAVEDTWRKYKPPFFISNVHAIPMGKSLRILVSSNHYLHNPNQIVIL